MGSGWVKPFPLPWLDSSPHSRAGLVDLPHLLCLAATTLHIWNQDNIASFYREIRLLFTAFTPTVLGLFTSLTTTCCMIHWSTARYIGACWTLVKSFFIQLLINDSKLCPYANNLPVYCTLLSQKNNSHFPIHTKFINNQWFLWIVPFYGSKIRSYCEKSSLFPQMRELLVVGQNQLIQSLAMNRNWNTNFLPSNERLDLATSRPSQADARLW